MLESRKVVKRYMSKTAVNDVSFDVIVTDIAILVVIVISYLATSFMLDKKVSV